MILITARTSKAFHNFSPTGVRRREAQKPVNAEEGQLGKKANGSVLCIGDDAVRLNLRCALLKEHGWGVFSATTGHEALIRLGQEPIEVAAVILDLDSDGSESALIAGELRRLRPDLAIIMLVTDGKTLAPGATQQADAVIPKSEEAHRLVETLKNLPGPS